MKALWMVMAIATGGLTFAAGSALASGNAFENRKQMSIRLCTDAVAKRTGNANISVYRTLSYENYRSVWMTVGGGHSQYKCLVEKNGPNSYFIKSVRQL